MSSNLPPGVTNGMIEDQCRECIIEIDAYYLVDLLAILEALNPAESGSKFSIYTGGELKQDSWARGKEIIQEMLAAIPGTFGDKRCSVEGCHLCDENAYKEHLFYSQQEQQELEQQEADQ